MSIGDALAASALGLLALASMAGGTNASFTATTVNLNNLLGTALLSISNDKPNDGDLVSISNLVPGDTATRTVTVSNSGSAGFAYSGAIATGIQTVLWTDTVKGLQVEVKRGATSLYSGALKNLAIPASSTIAPSATDTLTFVFSLPSTADNSFQGLTQTFTITYTATQLGGTAR
ncbi:MAG TPA: TasA family protein [Candidatus Limnocylindria bacterium]